MGLIKFPANLQRATATQVLYDCLWVLLKRGTLPKVGTVPRRLSSEEGNSGPLDWKKKSIWFPLLNLTGFASMEFTAVGNTFAWGEKCLLQVRVSEREREKKILNPLEKVDFKMLHILLFSNLG